MLALVTRPNRSVSRLGFSLVELIAVMVVLAILAGVAAPRFFSYSTDAKSAALQGTLGGVRTGIANFFGNASIEGTPAYPTYAELTTVGTVMQEDFPENPYNGIRAVQRVNDRNAADNRTVSNENRFGWNYFVDNNATPPVAIFWANSTEDTTVAERTNNNGRTTYFQANEL
jgi:MSHA pilin protein MshA